MQLYLSFVKAKCCVNVENSKTSPISRMHISYDAYASNLTSAYLLR